jgi:hypothetical protein
MPAKQAYVLPDDLRFLASDDIAAEHKTILLQAFSERQRDERAAQTAGVKEAEAARLTRLQFWHNTPLVTAAVGVITIAAQFGSAYFLSNQTGALEIEQARTEFSFRVMEAELAKIDPLKADQRAEVLLFLTKVGVLNGLNTVELEKYALNPTSIPSTIGQPSYDLPRPTDIVGQTRAANLLYQVAVEELNADVDEVASSDRVAKYWAALSLSYTGADVEVPWSGAFTGWLIIATGNPDAIDVSPSNVRTFQRGKVLGAALSEEEMPLPGDIVYYVQNPEDIAKAKAGEENLRGTSGVVHEIEGATIRFIAGNTGNGIRIVERPLNDARLLGYLRIGKTSLPAEPQEDAAPSTDP